MSTEQPGRGAVMPYWNPPFGQGPYPMERAEMMIIECEADRAELARITPSFCEPGDSTTVKVFFANNSQPPVSLSFYEIGVIQEVVYQGEPVVTIPCIWVSDDLAMLAGRDIFGMTKLLMDDNRLQVHANQLFGCLSRSGVVMAEGSMVLDREAAADELPFEGLASVYERHIPDPNPEKPSLRQLVKLQVTDRTIEGRCWMGRGHVETRHPLNSGLASLGLRATDRAWYGVYRWNLPAGEIVEQSEV